MTDITAQKAQELEQLRHALSHPVIKTSADAKSWISNLTKYIYDFKMTGGIYDFYDENVEYHKLDKTPFDSIDAIVADVSVLLGAFPDLSTDIESLIVHQVNPEFYKISRRLHFHGTNLGVGKYGPPTGKSLAGNCTSMSMIHLKKICGRWKITFELYGDSDLWLKTVQTNKKDKGEERC